MLDTIKVVSFGHKDANLVLAWLIMACVEEIISNIFIFPLFGC